MDQAVLARRVVTWRAAAVLWRSRARAFAGRVSAARHLLVSVALVTFGCAGALVGGALVGRWCLGVVLLAESAAAVGFGLFRDDGRPRRQVAPTVEDVLEAERWRP